MGALYALEHPTQVKKLILLAPALSFPAFARVCEKRPPVSSQVPTIIFHGTDDTVVPLEPVKRIAERIFLDLDFHVVPDDHRLSKTFQEMDWETLLA